MITLVSKLLFAKYAFGSDFFDTDSYDPTKACYDEFFNKKDKNAWAACCQSHPWSDNCDDKYYPADVCYSYMEVGSEAIWAGQDGRYPNSEWTSCCKANCGDITMCRSSYCKDWADDVEDFFEYWGAIIGTIIGVCLLIAACVIGLCCCGFCACGKFGRKKADERKAKSVALTPQQHNQHGIDPYAPQYNQQPAVIVVQDSSSSSDDEKVVVVRHEVQHV